MPMVTSYNDPLPCLTFGAKYFKIMFNSVALCGTFNPSQFLFFPCRSFQRPHGKFLILFDEKEKSRYLIGREVLLLMGIPINRMVGLEDASENVFWIEINKTSGEKNE